jgi:hypothetical protein
LSQNDSKLHHRAPFPSYSLYFTNPYTNIETNEGSCLTFMNLAVTNSFLVEVSCLNTAPAYIGLIPTTLQAAWKITFLLVCVL